jgi:hypothetical protein
MNESIFTDEPAMTMTVKMKDIYDFNLCKNYYRPKDYDTNIAALSQCKANVRQNCAGYNKKCEKYCK